MRFGDYIREARRGLNWTQPDAAREIGIEQSYLSKLESGKSYPSEEVFSSLMRAYKLEVSDLNEKLFAGDLDRLREISEVRTSILQQANHDSRRSQRWVIAGIGALTFGGACLGAFSLAEGRITPLYQYRTEGPSETVGNDIVGPHGDAETWIKEEFIAIEDNRGVVFSEVSAEGTRTWRFYGVENATLRSPLRWFIIPAIALILGALGCFFASYRVRRRR